MVNFMTFVFWFHYPHCFDHLGELYNLQSTSFVSLYFTEFVPCDVYIGDLGRGLWIHYPHCFNHLGEIYNLRLTSLVSLHFAEFVPCDVYIGNLDHNIWYDHLGQLCNL